MIVTNNTEIDNRVTTIKYNNKEFAEVKYGEWIECETMAICNCCGNHFLYEYNDVDEFKFCPNCGADMR